MSETFGVPHKIVDEDGTEWIFWKHKPDDRETPLSYRLQGFKGGVSLAPYMVETMFTRVGRPEPKSEIVVQGRYECAAASLAMLLGEKLFHVKRAMGKMQWRNDDAGASNYVMIGAARLLGRDLIEIKRSEISPDMGPASITLPSLNIKGMFHAVTWNGKEILDPNWGKEGRKFWGCEWNPKMMRAHRSLILLEGNMTNAERDEYDEAVRAREEDEIQAIKAAVWSSLKKDAS